MKLSLPGARGNLYYSVFASSLASTAVGTHYSWSSPTIPKLQEPGSWLPVSDEEASWIGSLTALGTVFGPFLGGWLVNCIGRRRAIMSAVVLSLVAWVILLFSTKTWGLYIGRFIGGVGGGIAFLSCPIYVAEISEPEVRGALGSLFAFFLVGGYLIEYTIGPFVSYSILIIINFIPSVLFFVLFCIAPESPYFFLRKDNISGATETLTWLRTGRRSEDVQQELNEIQLEISRSKAEKVTLSELVRTRGNRMALLISCGMVAGQQFSGVNVVLFYGQNIFMMAGTSFSSSVSTIIMGVMLFVAGGFAPPLASTFGMKNMFIASAIGMSVFQFVLCLYFYFNGKNYDMSSFVWLPVTSLAGYILCYTVGFGPLPWAVMAEVFPSNMKALASAITASFCWLIGFILTKFFNNISELLGAYVAFLIFAICCIFALLFTIFVLPDTRGMTLQEILDLLNKRDRVSSKVENGQTSDGTNG